MRVRFYAWNYALDLLQQRPMLGHGQGGYVLLSDQFGACGLCGSIGWAQRLRDPEDLAAHRAAKLRLWKRLARLLPLAVFKNRESVRDRKLWKLRRNFVPHGAADPAAWCAALDAPARRAAP